MRNGASDELSLIPIHAMVVSSWFKIVIHLPQCYLVTMLFGGDEFVASLKGIVLMVNNLVNRLKTFSLTIFFYNKYIIDLDKLHLLIIFYLVL